MTRFLAWSSLLHVLTICSSQILQKPPHVEPKYSMLNLHFDHCKHPMVFSKVNLICECPEPLTRVGDTCKCDGCIFLEIEEKYSAGAAADVPQYIDEVLEEMEEETQGNSDDPGNESQNATLAPSTMKKKRGVNDIYHEEENETLASFQSILYLKGTKRKQNGAIPVEKTPDGFRRMLTQSTLNRKKEKQSQNTFKSDHKILKVKGQSFSVIGSSAKGGTQSGAEKTSGYIQSQKGIGALALGSGGGSAASAAFIGPGKSDLTVSSKGAAAKGITMIGNGARNASSTNTVLAGANSHAAAANAQGEKGLASGVSVSTGKVAVAATAAAGNASSSAASAAEDKGDIKNKDNGKKQDVAASSSAGSSQKEFEKLKNKNAKGVDTSFFTMKPVGFNFQDTFSRKR